MSILGVNTVVVAIMNNNNNNNMCYVFDMYTQRVMNDIFGIWGTQHEK